MLRHCVTAFILFFLSNAFLGQNHDTDVSLSVMFYNVENLFDCQDDSLKLDDEFMPDGDKHWSVSRMYNKVKGVSKVILAANEWNPPTLVGLCEVENESVLKKLIYTAGLNELGYRFVHYESPDRRGIDVALLYRSTHFDVIDSKNIWVSDSALNLVTRDVLYVRGRATNGDTLHVMVCHWPSKRGGALQSEYKRVHVAQKLSQQIDSLVKENTQAKIIVMGDFNAELKSESLQLLCSGNGQLTSYADDHLWRKEVAGSHKYQGHWSLIDHILVGKGLRDLSFDQEFEIVDLPFLFEEDVTYSGVKPRRTYVGPRYIGGVSDHLPVLLSLSLKKEGSQKDSPNNP